MMTPAVNCFLLLFSRHHQKIAARILAYNEKGNYAADASTLTLAQRVAQDESIFQLARNVNGARLSSQRSTLLT